MEKIEESKPEKLDEESIEDVTEKLDEENIQGVTEKLDQESIEDVTVNLKKKKKGPFTGKECKFCNKFIKSRSQIKDHEKKCESLFLSQAETIVDKDGEKKFICDFCKETYKSIIGLRIHKRKHVPPGGYICVCGERFCMKQDLDKHKEIKHLVYKCQLCPLSFTDKEAYVEHIQKIHDGQDREYRVCEDCGKQFKTNVLLLHHKQSLCGTIKPYECNVCKKTFANQWSLKTHKLLHSNDKKFCCSFCGRKYFTKSRMVNHERTHTQEKAYVCQVCNKGFSHAQSLVTHATLHTGIKPYSCECCGARFSCVSNLQQHRRTRRESCGLPQYCKKITKTAPRAKVQTAKIFRKKQPVMCFKRLAEEIAKPYIFPKKRKTNSPVLSLFCDEIFLPEDSSDAVRSVENSIQVQHRVENSEQVDFINDQMLSKTLNLEEDKIISEPDFVHVPVLNDPLSSTEIEIKQEAPESVLEMNILTKCENDQEKEDNIEELKVTDRVIKTEIETNDFETNDNNFDHEKDYFGFLDDYTKPETYDIEDIKTVDLININSKGIKVKTEDNNDDKGYEIININNKIEYQESFENSIKSDKIAKRKSLRVVLFRLEPDEIKKLTKKSQKIKLNKRKRTKELDNSLQPNETFECGKCPKVYHQRLRFISHCIKEHEMQLNEIDKQLEPDEINKLIKRSRKNKFNKRKHTKEPDKSLQPNVTFQCDKCPKVFHQRLRFISHCIKSHEMQLNEIEERIGKEPLNSDPLRCQYCGKKYYNMKLLEQHKLLHGPEGTLIFKCSLCPKYFESSIKATEHAKIDHFDKLTCKYCQKIFSSLEALRVHLKTKHDNLKNHKKRNFVCQTCGRNFSSFTILNDHERSNCGQNPLYECKICGKKYNTAGSLKTHENIHTKKNKYKCPYCNKEFSTPYNIKCHIRSHTGEKPYKCQYCDKAYPYVESLYTHLTVHTGIKRYVCNGCGDRFACVSNLQNHRRTYADTCGKLPLQPKSTLKMSYAGGSLKIG